MDNLQNKCEKKFTFESEFLYVEELEMVNGMGNWKWGIV